MRSVKYLIPRLQLSWNKYVQRIVNRAVQVDTFPHILKFKTLPNQMYFRSIAEYASLPLPLPCNVNKLEATQKTAARLFVIFVILTTLDLAT